MVAAAIDAGVLDDTTLIPTHELWPAMVRSLSSSRNFILVASCDAAKSKFVEQEVAFWLANKDLKTFYIVVTDGELEMER